MADLLEADVFQVQHVDYSINPIHLIDFCDLKSHLKSRNQYNLELILKSHTILESDRPLSLQGNEILCMLTVIPYTL